MSKQLPFNLFMRQALLYPLTSPYLPPANMVAKGYSYAAGQLTGTLEVYPMGEIEKDFTVILPEQVRTNADANVAIFKVDADLYPFGITLNSIQVTLLSNGTYTLGFREYTQAGTDAPTLVSYIETITLSSQGHKKVLEADITDKDIAAGNYIYVYLSAVEIPWVKVKMIFTPKES